MTAKTAQTTQDLPYKPEDLALIPKYVQNIGLMRVAVISSSYFRDPILDQHPELQMQLNTTYKTTVYTNPDSKQSWAHIEFAVTAIPIDKNFISSVPFKIESTIEVRYTYSGADLEGQEFSKVLNAFSHTTAVSHAWSFFRQIVYDALSRMLLPSFAMPLFYHPGLVLPDPHSPKVAKTAPKPKK